MKLHAMCRPGLGTRLLKNGSGRVGARGWRVGSGRVGLGAGWGGSGRVGSIFALHQCAHPALLSARRSHSALSGLCYAVWAQFQAAASAKTAIVDDPCTVCEAPGRVGSGRVGPAASRRRRRVGSGSTRIIRVGPV